MLFLALPTQKFDLRLNDKYLIRGYDRESVVQQKGEMEKNLQEEIKKHMTQSVNKPHINRSSKKTLDNIITTKIGEAKSKKFTSRK